MTVHTEVSAERTEKLRAMADRLRRHSLAMANEAGSGHPTSCLSCAEIMSVLFFHYLRFDVKRPEFRGNDRFVLSKGHATPILWATWAEAGAFPLDELPRYRSFDSTLEGHPTPRNRFVDVATGSLGQGLSMAAGMALAARMERVSNRVYALLGDGELAEGAVWEAAAQASHLGLDGLTAIVDVNRLGQNGPTRYGHDLDLYARQFEAFGWHAVKADGHDVESLIEAFDEAIRNRGRPSVILARTIKGKGAPAVEDDAGYHGKPVTGADLQEALETIGGRGDAAEAQSLNPPASTEDPKAVREPREHHRPEPPRYGKDDQVATRDAYGTALAKLGAVHPRIVSIDGEVRDSTRAQAFAAAFPDRFMDGFIAEQNMTGMAIGMAACGWRPFVSSFASFHTRAHDFIRMAAVSRASITFCGSHSGVSIGPDGPSQMGLEDIAMMRAIEGSTVLCPADAVSAERCVELAANTGGIVYLRTMRPKTPILYGTNDRFTVGGSRVLRSSGRDRVTIVATGITVHEALAAHERLASENIAVRVIDLYSVKPLDRETLLEAARETGAVVTAEDHRAEGGLGEAVAAELAGECPVRTLAVRGMPRSGTKEQLLAAFGIDAAGIAAAVRDVLTKRRRSTSRGGGQAP